MNELIIAPVIAEAPKAPAISAEAEQIKQELLTQAGMLAVINTTEVRDIAIRVAGEIKGHITQVEKDRKMIKDPFYKMGCAIDDAAKGHVAKMEIELTRINREVGAFNEEQRQKLVREQEARDREAKRLADEAAAAQREADRQAELLRKEQETLALKQKQAQEALERKGKEPTAEQKAKALQAQLEAQEREDALEADRIRKQKEFDEQRRKLEQEQIAAAERARAEKATGGSQRTDYEIQITDIKALLAARPDCVKLTPDLVQLKYVIRGTPDIQIPGVIYRAISSYSAKAR